MEGASKARLRCKVFSQRMHQTNYENYEKQRKEVQLFARTYTGYKLSSSICAVIFITLVLSDVWKAYRRKATWIPGRALVLSAIMIQLLLFIDHLDVSVNSSNQDLKDMQLILLVEEQLLIDSRRVMMCVFIAYLLPGIVSRRLRSVWGDVGALALIVIAHMVYEAYFLLTYDEWEISRNYEEYWAIYDLGPVEWLIPSYIAVSLAMILLVVLLSCAVIAGKSIRNTTSQKVPSVLSSCCENRLCSNIKDHVLRSWIVVRASQPDYIMARSVFSAFAGVVVTVCDVLLVVKWICVALPVHYPFDITVYATHFSFVVVGSIVVVIRWFTAVFYFPKHVGYLLYCEDFWTRELVQQKGDLRGWGSFLSILLTVFLWVQKLMVKLSKICGYLSQFVFGIIRLFMIGKCKSGLLKKTTKSGQFKKYEDALNIMLMPGESAYNLWRANKYAFKDTENNFKKGIEIGNCTSKELNSLKEYKTETPKGEVPTSLEEEKYFKAVGKNSWKMRAVSLVHLIIYFYDGTNSDLVNDCIEAYRQAMCFMDMVDHSDPEVKLVSEAADNEFNTIESVWKKHRKMQSLENSNRAQWDEKKASNRMYNQLEEASETDDQERESKRLHNEWEEDIETEYQEKASNKLLKQKIRMPLEVKMEQLSWEEERGGKEGHRNRCDLKTIAAEISLYKIWKATVPNPNPNDANRILRCKLANIIFHCLEEEVLDKALRKNCNKWAEDGEEKEIFNAAFIAGKAEGVWQQIREGKDDVVPVVVEGVEG